ncbi:MAG: hypothetical protein U9N45_01440 [Gemmatimonadota bacterium]|nr:hypothetical protein [Gemmatimonadota bacterium]
MFEKVTVGGYREDAGREAVLTCAEMVIIVVRLSLKTGKERIQLPLAVQVISALSFFFLGIGIRLPGLFIGSSVS